MNNLISYWGGALWPSEYSPAVVFDQKKDAEML